MSEYQLSKKIIESSIATTWDKAKLEWQLQEIYKAEEADICLCGHYPIMEICILHNSKNGNTVQVGNCCVNKFMGLQSDKIFSAYKKVVKNVSKPLNAETIEYAYNKNWINEWEHKFYFDTMRKRKLSEKQGNIRSRINTKIIRRIERVG